MQYPPASSHRQSPDKESDLLPPLKIKKENKKLQNKKVVPLLNTNGEERKK